MSLMATKKTLGWNWMKYVEDKEEEEEEGGGIK